MAQFYLWKHTGYNCRLVFLRALPRLLKTSASKHILELVISIIFNPLSIILTDTVILSSNSDARLGHMKNDEKTFVQFVYGIFLSLLTSKTLVLGMF